MSTAAGNDDATSAAEGGSATSPARDDRGWSPSARPAAPAPTIAFSDASALPRTTDQPAVQAPPGAVADPAAPAGETAVITSRRIGLEGSASRDKPARAGRSSWLTTGLVGLLAALLAVATVLLAVRYQDGRATEAARMQGGLASRDAARLLLSYDYKSLDKNFAAGKAVTTGNFTKQFQTLTDTLKTFATDFNAVVRADVIESSVVEATPNELTALLFVNSTATSTKQSAGQGPNIVQNRVQMHLRKVGGRWLVDQLVAL